MSNATPRRTNDALYRAHLVFEVFRATGEREFPAQLSSVFLWIASHEGCLQEDVAEALCIARSSVSRNITWLGSTHRSGKTGLKLVRRERAVDGDPRRYRLFLTPKGKHFSSLIEKHLTAPLPKDYEHNS